MATHPEITHVRGRPMMIFGAYDLADLGYTLDEFFIKGAASSHGTPDQAADYTTRIVVVAPTDAARFNGTVLVEWLNVSGGIDAPAVWIMAHREIMRAGYAYVAVSAQQVGVQGGLSILMDMSLKTQQPERYSALNHPGDAYSYDIFTQAGQLVREAVNTGVLGSLKPEFVVAVGESQSAMFLTTYVNVVDHHADVYDGFLVHSRFGPAAPVDGSSIFAATEVENPTVKFRRDLRVPLMNVITETDLLGAARAGYHLARQPDHELLRTWEIAGSSHADIYTIQVARIDTGSAPLDKLVAAYSPIDTVLGQKLSRFINFAPQHHYVLQAALAGLHRWVRTGTPPPSAPTLELSDADPPQLVLDANGLATGGVRSPWVDVPIARTSGVGTSESALSYLFGSGEPFDAATIKRLYPGGVADYLVRFTHALDAAIASGFLLAADRDEIRALAEATYPAGA